MRNRNCVIFLLHSFYITYAPAPKACYKRIFSFFLVMANSIAAFENGSRFIFSPPVQPIPVPISFLPIYEIN
jgi:hypothetical protein